VGVGVGQFDTKCLPTGQRSRLEIRQNSIILFVISQEHTFRPTQTVIRPLVQTIFKIRQNTMQLLIYTVRPPPPQVLQNLLHCRSV
jgi:hypothetical protein